MTDPIADMLTRITNATMVGKELTIIPYSKLKFEIANILLKHNLVKSFSVKGRKVRKHIEVELAYEADGSSRISGANRISKPSRRVYLGVNNIKSVRQGQGFLVMSTPRGIMVGDEARKAKVGGEALFRIW
ncbi:MAG: 30S ribosomal protein S8 [Parcubacteria group bacterium RIFCSPHIGHO2_01_FULL_45_26]|nr:ribosomal protein S8 [uncultured bacterium]OHB17545.1 MAG: 30S ribosomal protein S8 [Parcubacteria group bacterium RIFCSPHIGHO2_01_FULL_45_26]